MTISNLLLLAFAACPPCGRLDEQPAARPLAAIKLELDALRGWGTRKYAYSATPPGGQKRVHLGTVTLRTEVREDRIVLDDALDLTFRGERLTPQIIHLCKKDSVLAPLRIEVKGEGAGEFRSFVAVVEGTRVTITSAGKERRDSLPSDTVSSWALFRLVTLVPREAGTRISFDHWLESEEMHRKQDFLLESLGPDPIARDGRRVACTKFRLTGGGNLPAFYWVSESGVLEQVLIDERKWIVLEGNDPVGQPSGSQRRK